MRRLAVNVDTLYFAAVGVSPDHLSGVEWLNRVGRDARDGCVSVDMQKADDVKSVRRLMEDPGCLWLQVDVSGGGWAPCDAPVVVSDGYVAAGALGNAGVDPGGAGALLPPPQVALSLRSVAEEFSMLVNDDGDESGADIDMVSSSLEDRTARRLWPLGGMMGKPGCISAGTGVGSVVLVPAVPELPVIVGRSVREGTVPDSVDGGDLEPSNDVDGIDPDFDDPACGGGGRDGRYECSCEAELGHLSGKVRRLEDLVRLLVADAGLARWGETRRMENLRRKMKMEREVVEWDHMRKVAAERAAGEERKRIATCGEQARKAEEVRKSQEEVARLWNEQIAATRAAVEVSVGECVLAMISEELVP